MTDYVFDLDDEELTMSVGTSGGSGFDGVHNDLAGRDAAAAHPSSSVTAPDDLDGHLAGAGTVADALQLVDDLDLGTGSGAVDSVDGQTGAVDLSGVYAPIAHDHDGVYQPQSSTLTALAGLILSGSPGPTTFLRGDGAWSALPLQLVAQTVTGANAMTVQLTGLSPYRFLILMTSARGTESGTAGGTKLWAQFNGDTNTNYSDTTTTGQTGIAVQHLPTAGFGWGSVGLCLIDNTAANATKHLVGVGLVGGSQNVSNRGGLWTNTTDLISTIELSGTGSNEIAAGASFVLLGVPR